MYTEQQIQKLLRILCVDCKKNIEQRSTTSSYNLENYIREEDALQEVEEVFLYAKENLEDIISQIEKEDK